MPVEKRSANILVVDDNPYNLEILCKILETEGYQTRVANNGVAALRTLQFKPPDLILLDIMLPDILGYEVCRRLKEDVATQHIPVLFISALEETQDKLEGFAAGAVDYITKPFQHQEVLARIENHLSLHRLRQQLEAQNQQLKQEIKEREQAETALQQAKRSAEEAFMQLQKMQAELVHAEKMASLGQLIAGIAHEINSPLAALLSSTEHLKHFLSGYLPHLPAFLHALNPQQTQQFMQLLTEVSSQPIGYSTREARQIRRQLSQQLHAHHIEKADIQADLLVQIGLENQFEALLDILRSPQGLSFLQHLHALEDVCRNQKTMEFAIKQAQKIILALKNYVHQEPQGAKKEKVNIIFSLETVLTLYNHQLRDSVSIHKDYQNVPEIPGYADELNQVWTNLIHNALQAMEYQGELSIAVHIAQNAQAQEGLAVIFHDTGCGVPEALQEKIFQPFFTTKSAPEGTGLGLDIARKIVQKHQGIISLHSQPGDTTFTIWLPI